MGPREQSGTCCFAGDIPSTGPFPIRSAHPRLSAAGPRVARTMHYSKWTRFSRTGALGLSGWLFHPASSALHTIPWSFGAAGLIFLTVTSGLTTFAVIRQRGQLRTEKHEQTMRCADIQESAEFAETSQRAQGTLIERTRRKAMSRKNATASKAKRRP